MDNAHAPRTAAEWQRFLFEGNNDLGFSGIRSERNKPNLQ